MQRTHEPRAARRPARGPRLLVLCVLMLSLGASAGWHLRLEPDAQAIEADPVDPYAKLNTFAQVLAQIEGSYVEPLDEDALVYGAIKGMMRTLDPHSVFMTPEELRQLRDRTAGQYVGVGVEIGLRNDRVTIIAPLPGGPADAAGVRAGDVIVTVDGASAKEWSVQEAAEHLRGPAGSSVRLGLRRAQSEAIIEVELVRQVVEMISVQHELLEPGYGYIAVRSFTANVSDELRASHDALVADSGGPLDGLVLDLRNNPGGLLREAVHVANGFLESGLIVSTEGRHGVELARHEARADLAYIDCPLVVLVNAGSASASEIVAGALQDHKRAVIVGAQTYGKGSVQQIYDLDDGGGLKLTVARYYTPAHRSIQGLGITPDILAEDVELPEAEGPADAPRERDLPGALEGEDGAPGPPPRAEAGAARVRDLPVRTALDQLKAYRILSGSGR